VKTPLTIRPGSKMAVRAVDLLKMYDLSFNSHGLSVLFLVLAALTDRHGIANGAVSDAGRSRVQCWFISPPTLEREPVHRPIDNSERLHRKTRGMMGYGVA